MTDLTFDEWWNFVLDEAAAQDVSVGDADSLSFVELYLDGLTPSAAVMQAAEDL